jgi:MurNAc alpha-1-phosphate uridylyltransferase
MKAMIFAAGVGSRLKELTRDTPKCLMLLGRETILEHVIAKLKAAGVTSLVINVHHHAEQILEFAKAHNNFGVPITFSHEPTLLDTGGGLKKVAAHFAGEKAFLIHNADVYCDLDLSTLVRAHMTQGSIATLAVMKRSSTRGLYFSKDAHLLGWTQESSPPPQNADLLGFCGISVASDELFSYMESNDTFSIIKPFLSAARATQRVFGQVLTDTAWVDIGTPEQLHAVRDQLVQRDGK